MTHEELRTRLDGIRREQIPLPGAGSTATRHRRLMEVGREDLSLAKLAEAHWDALAILAEAGKVPSTNALYAVWASEAPGKAMHLEPVDSGYRLNGTKMFCSGTGLVDRALITAGEFGSQLVEISLTDTCGEITSDYSAWKAGAFKETMTGSVTFKDVIVRPEDCLGESGWYTNRIGFWHGACGPAACWAGGAAGLLDYALESHRNDAHTLAHLGAMYANVWALEALLETAGNQIDTKPVAPGEAHVRALSVRHTVEQLCADILTRFGRAYGPFPLAMDEAISRRYSEVTLYLRQCHAERDLESLAKQLIVGTSA